MWYASYLIKTAMPGMPGPGRGKIPLPGLNQLSSTEQAIRASRLNRPAAAAGAIGGGGAGRALMGGLKWGLPLAAAGMAGYGLYRGYQGLKNLFQDRAQQIDEYSGGRAGMP